MILQHGITLDFTGASKGVMGVFFLLCGVELVYPGERGRAGREGVRNGNIGKWEMSWSCRQVGVAKRSDFFGSFFLTRFLDWVLEGP